MKERNVFQETKNNFVLTEPEIFYSNGVNYMRFPVDYKIEFLQEPLLTRDGNIINIGDRIVKLGPKRRNTFEMKDGHYMTYEGIHIVMGTAPFEKPFEQRYAIFSTGAHNPAGAEIIYKYAFIIVPETINPERVHCFLSGSGKGMRDIMLDPAIRWQD